MICAIALTGPNSPKIQTFNTKLEAHSTGNGFMLFESPEELAASNLVPTQTIVDLFNKFGEAKVSRFSDRLSGAKRLFKVAPVPINQENGIVQMSKVAKQPKVKKPRTKSEGGPKGRKPLLAGKKLYPVGDAKTANPRRKGSFGHKSLQLIIDQPGISFENFIKAGGRSKDLLWDIASENAETR